jgi:hypothetical protein
VNLPPNIKTDSVIQVALTYFVLLLVSFGLGLFLFMRNPWMESDLNTDSYIWFVEFSRSIFQAQSAYYAESILLPLIAKVLGATKTLMAYKLLCGLLTICILPITAIFAQRYFQNGFKTLLFIILFGFSFQYLQYYILGFPDPLTVILLLLAVFQKRLSTMFILLVLAMLSHFSMAALGALGLAGMLYFSPSTKMYSIKKSAGVVIAAIVCGKALLLAWYTVFHYQLLSRLDWALGKGYAFFLERYETDAIAFWLTPGIPFLILYCLITAYFCIQKQYAFVFSALVAIAISYVALFWTVDGLRVFAVVIAAPYAYLLLSFIQRLPIWRMTHQSLVTT